MTVSEEDSVGESAMVGYFGGGEEDRIGREADMAETESANESAMVGFSGSVEEDRIRNEVRMATGVVGI